ncbi:ferritin-like domain-containing protein [Crocosphaera sp.]|uniref:ferritin-like domain-containing protein n=1 Tax=Crocosphaera sp. TaxID=2729996 RepID=UPI003F26E1A3|nr:ferritin-like domain-containing protein [Crocosphaera sp.]
MDNNNQKISGFNLSHLELNHPTQRILRAALQKKNHSSFNPETVFWNATFFSLDRVKYFQEATPEQQQKILTIANRDILEEIYWVEQAGVGYMAKMVTLSETFEERLLYGLFAADEATHLGAISDFFSHPPVFADDAFLGYLSSLLVSSDKLLLITLMQVVLEGWGMSHYRSLANNCQDISLKKVLQNFLESESRHHALGVTQLRSYDGYSQESLEAIHDTLTYFLYMVQIGPQRLLKAIEQGLGYLSINDKIKILEELQTELSSNTRLKLLQSLMMGTVPTSILQSLEEQGSFHAYGATQCLQ